MITPHARPGVLDNVWSMFIIAVVIVAFLMFPAPFINTVKFFGESVQSALRSSFHGDSTTAPAPTTPPTRTAR